MERADILEQGVDLFLEVVELQTAEEGVDLLLQTAELVVDLLVLLRLLEVGAAVGGVVACEVEVAAPLARCLAIALDLAAFTFVAVVGGESVSE